MLGGGAFDAPPLLNVEWRPAFGAQLRCLMLYTCRSEVRFSRVVHSLSSASSVQQTPSAPPPKFLLLLSFLESPFHFLSPLLSKNLTASLVMFALTSVSHRARAFLKSLNWCCCRWAALSRVRCTECFSPWKSCFFFKSIILWTVGIEGKTVLIVFFKYFL